MLDESDIRERLPHRGDMLLLTRVLEWERGTSIVAEVDVSADAFWVEGHFPGNPVMPGVLIAEAVAQAAALLVVMGAEELGGHEMYLVGLDRYRIRRPVVPGETLKIAVRLERQRKTFCTFDGEAWVGEERVAEGRWLAALGTKEGA